MRRRGLITAGFVVAAAALAALLVMRDSDGDISFRSDGQRGWRVTKWMVSGISPDQRRLSLLFASGGCTRDRGRAQAQETADAVRIRVESNEIVEGTDDIVCTADLRRGEASVKLARPLAGRKIYGADPKAWPVRLYGPSRAKGDRLVLLAPRLKGLRADDAATFLRTHGFKAIPLPVRDRTREVLGTRPPRGTELRTQRPRIRLLVHETDD